MALSPLFNIPFLILTLSILTEAGVLPQSYNARGIHARSPTATTPHVVQISRKASSEVSLWRKAYGVAKVLSLDYGLELAATLTIGGTDFEMILDTGSSDTWIAGNNFSCQDFGFEVPQNYCGLGATYNFKGDKSTFQQIPHENFNIQYGDGSAIAGLMGYENLAIAGIEVPKQEIAVMTMAYWRGDGQTSGLLGLGYPGLTSAFKGDDPNNDFNAPHAPYDPIFTTMVKQNNVLPIFSLAIERGPANGLAGVLAIGGIPPVKVSSPFISSPIVKTQFPFAGDVSSPTYQFYSIYPDAFVFGRRNHSDRVAEPATTTANLTAFDSSKILHLVDSGTSLNLLPQEIADAVNAQFVPPAVYDPSEGLYTVPCNAKAPYFGVKISGQTLFFNTKDMIFKFNGVCRSTITGGAEPYILGDPFFRNVLAVFDVGAGLMRFASRPNY